MSILWVITFWWSFFLIYRIDYTILVYFKHFSSIILWWNYLLVCYKCVGLNIWWCPNHIHDDVKQIVITLIGFVGNFMKHSYSELTCFNRSRHIYYLAKRLHIGIRFFCQCMVYGDINVAFSHNYPLHSSHHSLLKETNNKSTVWRYDCKSVCERVCAHFALSKIKTYLVPCIVLVVVQKLNFKSWNYEGMGRK